MKISRNPYAWLLLLCLAAAANPASAQSKLQSSSELAGIENVLGIIRNVNLMQTDQKSNEFILDIMDTKTDVYGQNRALSGTKASVVTHGRVLPRNAAPLPPVRHRNTF